MKSDVERAIQTRLTALAVVCIILWWVALAVIVGIWIDSASKN